MGNTVLTTGGFKSQAPGIARKEFIRKLRKKGRGGGSSINRRSIAEEIRIKEITEQKQREQIKAQQEQQRRQAQNRIIKAQQTARRLQAIKKQQIILRRKILPRPIITKRAITKTLFEERKTIKKKISPRPISTKKVKEKITSSFDVITGGIITERRIAGREDKIQEDIRKFNDKYGKKTLGEEEFNKAQKEADKITKQQIRVEKDRTAFSKSGLSKFGKQLGIGGGSQRLTEGEARIQTRKNDKELLKAENKLKSLKNKKQTPIVKLQSRLTKSIIFGHKQEKVRIEERKKIRIDAGEVPIVPRSIVPTGIEKVTFIGKVKKGKGGKQTVDVIFQTQSGQVGIVKGVAVTKGKTTSTIVLGRAGKTTIKFPSGKKTVTGITSIVAKDKGISKATTIQLRKTVSLSPGIKAKITKNLQGIKQVTSGQVGTIAGKKIKQQTLSSLGNIKTKQIAIDDVLSVAGSLTKKDLTAIIGRSVTTKGAKAKFVGLIQGTKTASKSGKGISVGGQALSKKDLLQTQKAVNKVLGLTAGALAQAKKTQGLTKAQQTAIALVSIKNLIKTQKGTGRLTLAKINKEVKAITQTKTITTTKVLPRVRTGITVRSKTKARTKQKTISKSKTKQKARQKTSNQTRQKQRVAQRTRVAQQTRQQGALRRPTITTRPISIGKIPKAIKFNKKKKRVFAGTNKRFSYNVYGRVKGKFVKINKQPLTKQDALSRGSYAVDNTTARTFKIRPTKKVKKPGRLTKGEKGYYQKTKVKYRETKKRKGRNIKTPQKFIEKRKRLIDTKGEKRGLTLAKFLKQRGIGKKRKPKRGRTSSRKIRR